MVVTSGKIEPSMVCNSGQPINTASKDVVPTSTQLSNKPAGIVSTPEAEIMLLNAVDDDFVTWSKSCAGKVFKFLQLAKI
jgi:hypothetical protein